MHKRCIAGYCGCEKIMGEYLRAGLIAAEERAASNKIRHN
jgi:hypothetical protein